MATCAWILKTVGRFVPVSKKVVAPAAKSAGRGPGGIPHNPIVEEQSHLAGNGCASLLGISAAIWQEHGAALYHGASVA